MPTANSDATVTFPAGVPKSPRIALFARVTPGRKAIVSSVGVVPAREMRSEPDAVAFVTVTFAATAIAPVGMPQLPLIGKSRDAPG